MSTTFKTIGLVGNTADAQVADTVEALAGHLRERVALLLLSPVPCAVAGCIRVDGDELRDRADLVMSIGGDGTMLWATRLVAAKGTPLLGINRGRLGFLADISPDEMTQRVDEILSGQYVSETRSMLSARLDKDEETEGIALNDVVVQRAGDARLLEFETSINGVYVNTHGSDGLIVATPTGSTAYALSGGGPIIEPSLNAFVLVPICPHTLSDRPIVVDADSEIEVKLIDRADVTGQVSCDGRPMVEIFPGDVLRVRAAPFAITLLHPTGYDYFRILRSKLSWGRGSRRRR